MFLEYFGLRSLEDLPAADELRRMPVEKPPGLMTVEPGLATVPPADLTAPAVEAASSGAAAASGVTPPETPSAESTTGATVS